MARVSGAIGAIVVLVTGAAHAQSGAPGMQPRLPPGAPQVPPMAPPVPPGMQPAVPQDPALVTETEWYGWQTIAADVLMTASLATAIVNDDGGVAGASLIGYAAIAPIVHVVHGKGGAAAASLGMRVGAPVLGALVLASFCDGSSSGGLGCIGSAIGGMALGTLTVMVVDAAVLSRKRTVRPREAPVFSVAPQLTMHHEGAQIGIVGRF